MISIPVAVYNGLFEWQLNLFWTQHKRVYGDDAYKKAVAIIIRRNYKSENKCLNLDWDVQVPYKFCEAHFDYLPNAQEDYLLPINIQSGLIQIINLFDDEEVIELLDCDMFHIKPFFEEKVNDNEFFVSSIYENWHLKSLTNHRAIVQKHFKPNHGNYNGGFVPIIGKVKTYKKILKDWIDIHIKMAKEHPGSKNELIRWWSGMYSFQTACANNNIKMIDRDWVHVPPTNNLHDGHYICHYSCDNHFNKKKFPKTNTDNYPNNAYYNAIRDWLGMWKPARCFQKMLI